MWKIKKKESPYIVIETDSTEGNSEHLKTYIFSNPFREKAELRWWTVNLYYGFIFFKKILCYRVQENENNEYVSL